VNVIVVGPAPARAEVRAGRFFSHPVYDDLKAILFDELGLDRSCVQFTNAVNEPVSKPSATQITSARGDLQARISNVPDAAVLLLGSAPVQSVVGRPCLSSARGRRIEPEATKGFEGAFFFATWHPSILAIQPNLRRQWRDDLRRFVDLVHGNAARTDTVEFSVVESAAVYAPKKLVAYDLETSGLITNSYALPKVWMIGLSTRNPDGKIENYIGSTYVENYDKGPEILVGHNSRQFDDMITGWRSHDTQIMAYLLDNSRTKTGGYGLQALAVEYLGVAPWKDDVTWNWSEWDQLSPEDQERSRLYNARDTQYTLELAEVLMPKLKAAGLWPLYANIYLPVATIFGEIHRDGIYVDADRVAAVRQQLENERDEALEIIRAAAGEKFNPGSPQQVARLAENQWGLLPAELTGTGKPKIDDVCLEKWISYAEHFERKNVPVEHILSDDVHVQRKNVAAVDFLRAVQSYRHARKHLSTYVGAFEQARDAKGRVHPSYRITSTDTGRTATSDFPLQQLPRDTRLRGCIGAPPGWLFGSTDYSNIEQRVIAWLAQEPRLLAQFESFDAGTTPFDNHTLLAARLLSKPPGEVTSTERSLGKNIGFATQYLGTSRTIQDWLYKNFAINVSQDQGEVYRAAWFEAYPALIRWYEAVWSNLRAHDFTAFSVLRFTRRFGTPTGCHSQQQALEVYRQATNFHVQSFANHLGFAALIAARTEIERRPELSQAVRIVGYVHDSILWEAREEVVDAARSCVGQAMVVGAWNLLEENFPDLSKDRPLHLPLRVDTKIGTHWI
jgi:uracil-DNA glycosylase family 4